MSPTKLILAQMQESEKTYYQEEPVSQFSEQAISLSLCKNYLRKIMDTTLNRVELRNDIQEFLQSLNKK